MHLGRWSDLGRWPVKYQHWIYIECFLTSFNLCISNFLGLHFASLLAVQCYWFQWDFSMCWSAGRRGSRTGLQWSRTAAFEKLNTLLPFICTSLNNSSCFSSWVWGGYCESGKWCLCWFAKQTCYGRSVVFNTKRVLSWKLLSFVVLDLFSTIYLILYYPH